VRGGARGWAQAAGVRGRGLHSLTSELNLRNFGDISLTLKLNFSTFTSGHIQGLIWVIWGTK